MPILPNDMERRIFLSLNEGPGPLLDVVGALAFSTVSVALKLGVFDTLSSAPLTGPEIARQIKASERGTTLLLEALDAIGYVTKHDSRYANTAMTNKWLLHSSPTTIADFFPHMEDVLEMWGHIEESIRRGEPSKNWWEWLDRHSGGWRDYEAAMKGAANMSADEIVAKVKLPPGAHRLLDLGGGHGLHSIKFCQAHPALSATVFDLPQARDVAEETIAAEHMDERVTFHEGDFWVDDLGSGYDVTLLFNIIHMNSPEKNTELFRKVVTAANQKGLIVIMDQLAGGPQGGFASALARLQGLSMFNLVDGRTYTFEEISRWLIAAGFSNAQQINLRSAPGFSLVLGTRSG